MNKVDSPVDPYQFDDLVEALDEATVETSLKDCEREYVTILSEFGMDKDNFEYFQDETQSKILTILQPLLGPSSNDEECKGFVKKDDNCTCTCGDSISDHVKKEHEELVLFWCNRILDIPRIHPPPHQDIPRYNHLTLAIHGHGCDIPFLLKDLNKDLHLDTYLSYISVLSAVEHGCPYTGNSNNIIMQLNNAYKNQGVDPILQLTRLQQIHKDDANPNFFHIHNPSVDRFYQFTPEIKDRLEYESAGIYVLSARQGHVSFTYSDRTSLMQQNNLLSDSLHASLQWISNILDARTIKQTQNVTLFGLLYALFKNHPDMKIHIIDLGCRNDCEVKFIPSGHPLLILQPPPYQLHDYKRFENRKGLKRVRKSSKKIKKRKSKKNNKK